MKNNLWCIWLLAAVVLTGCVINYIPQAGKGVAVQNSLALFNVNGLQVQAQLRPWSYPPVELPDIYTPVWISIANPGNKPIEFTMADIALLESDLLQHDVIPIEQVAELLCPIDQNHPGRFAVLPAPNLQGAPLTRKQLLERYTSLNRRSFSFGSIAAGARKQGFVFFESISLTQPRLFLQVMGTRVEFVKTTGKL